LSSLEERHLIGKTPVRPIFVHHLRVKTTRRSARHMRRGGYSSDSCST
jgi:hypothetical protein